MNLKRPWWVYLIAALLLVAAAVAVSRWLNAKATASRPVEPWLTQTLDRGGLRRTISATGSVTPLNLIQVGSQVSGTIAMMGQDAMEHPDDTIADLFGVRPELDLLDQAEAGLAVAGELADADWTLPARI